MNFDETFNNVYVAFGKDGESDEGCVIRCGTHNGEVTSKQAITGRVCLGGLNEGFVRIEGKEFMAKDWNTGSFHPFGNEEQRKYDVYNKGHARFVVRVHKSGVCDLRSMMIGGCTVTTDSYICDLAVQNPVAMDVSKDGQRLAVLEDSYTDVKIFRSGSSRPHAIYRADGQSFKPLDICFYTIGGQECLIVADWLNDVLHVLDPHGKLISHLGADCL
jgi:hypothetical protein